MYSKFEILNTRFSVSGGGGGEQIITWIFNVYRKFEILNTRFSVSGGREGGTENNIDF